MAVPKTVFIDTCVFKAAQFEFTSRQFTALLAAAPAIKLKLLLPEPTEREISRHMKLAAQDAIAAIKAARKEHGVLRKAPHFPLDLAADAALLRLLQSQLQTAWTTFQGQFDLKKLDYTGIDLREIMRWYEDQTPPFGTGDKRKEFPDAISFAAIRDHAERTGELVAVVSHDKDFEKACEDAPGLFYFPEPFHFTNLLLTEKSRFKDAERIAANIRDALKRQIEVLFPDRGFDHALDPNGRGYVDHVVASSVEISEDDISVVGLGHNNFDVQFIAMVAYEADVEYDDPDSWISGDPGDDVFYLHRCSGRVSDETELNGTVRITMSEDWKTPTLGAVQIDEDVVEVEAGAPQEDDRDERDIAETAGPNS